MNSTEKHNSKETSASKYPRIEAFFSGDFAWPYTSMVAIIIGYSFWYKLSPDFGPEQALLSSELFVALLILTTILAAVATKSWRVFSKATKNWLIFPGTIAYMFVAISGSVVVSRYDGANFMKQYAQSIIDERCGKSGCNKPSDAGVISADIIHYNIGQQEELAAKIAKLDMLTNNINDLEHDTLPWQTTKAFLEGMTAKQAEYKSQQVNNLSAMREFVQVASLVCHNTAPANTLAPSLECTPQELFDYGKSLPAQYPQWTWILRHLAVLSSDQVN